MKSTKMDVGMRYGYLISLNKTESQEFGDPVWKCRCECGKILDVGESMLFSGVVQSCGCKKSKAINLKGEQFGKLTALVPVPDRGVDGSILWLCRCECGNYKVFSSNKLRMGHTTNCGCSIGEAARDAKTFIDGTCVEIILSDKVPKNNTSGIRGVTKKRNKWQAYINYSGKRQHLGSYDTKEEAARARSLAEEKIRDHIDIMLEKQNKTNEVI